MAKITLKFPKEVVLDMLEENLQDALQKFGIYTSDIESTSIEKGHIDSDPITVTVELKTKDA